jgi:hexosaminidase
MWIPERSMRTTERRRTVVLLAATLVAACASNEGERAIVDDDPVGELRLIPLPRTVSKGMGHLHFEPSSAIAVSTETEAAGGFLASVVRASTGWPWPVVRRRPNAGDIALEIDVALDVGEEGYALEVDDHHVAIRGTTPAGVFWGAQTLLQLLPAEVESADVVEDVAWRVPMVTIEDQPRFEWRGVMLDVARHFFTVDDVKRLIDLATRYKLNRFHLHLTDDSGWRVEIESWPKLTTIGATTDYTGGPGGYYTQAELADIVAYAQARFVTLVPEIDMPGHTNAALASYGELNESGEPTELAPTVPIGSTSLWIGGPDTEGFVDDVIGEIAAIISGPYIHIGGDETFTTEPEDYAAFIQMARNIVDSHGKTMIGWDEIGTVDLAPPFIVQYWLSSSSAFAASERGARVIASPARYAYLDMKYDESTPIGLSWAGFVDVRTAYEWDPVVTPFAESDMLGVESPLWTETIDEVGDIDLLMFPRLLGHAEIGWSSRDSRSWEEYRNRLAHHGLRLDAHGVGFYRSPLVDWLP